MFSKEQIEFMSSIGLIIDFNDSSDDDCCEIEEMVDDEIIYKVPDENYDANQLRKKFVSSLDDMEE